MRTDPVSLCRRARESLIGMLYARILSSIDQTTVSDLQELLYNDPKNEQISQE